MSVLDDLIVAASTEVAVLLARTHCPDARGTPYCTNCGGHEPQCGKAMAHEELAALREQGARLEAENAALVKQGDRDRLHLAYAIEGKVDLIRSIHGGNAPARICAEIDHALVLNFRIATLEALARECREVLAGRGIDSATWDGLGEGERFCGDCQVGYNDEHKPECPYGIVMKKLVEQV